jgi:proteasome accessory factor A
MSAGMQESLFGLETEYAFTHFADNGETLDREEGLTQLLHIAHKRLKCLRDSGCHGVYLSNGSRFYVDAGNHPELSTPECSDPWEVVRYLLAGERILTDLAAEVEKDFPNSRASIFRCNVDYFSKQTWGCHESYLHRSPVEKLAEEIIPHFVSRLIYTGAGGFDSHSLGLEFTLSPRVTYLRKKVSGESTEDRGIFHTKDEPLCGGGYHRLHVLCGESQCSQIGNLLKVGATDLVVRMIDAGVRPGRAVALRSPLASMRRYSRDPSGTRRELLASGEKRTAIEIQRHYLEAAEDHLSRAFMPPWAAALCAEWRRMLDRLEGGADSVSTILDWGIKRSLYREHAKKRGFEWEELPDWNPLIASVAELLGCPDPGPMMLRPERVFSGDSNAEVLGQLTPLLESRGTNVEEFRSFLALRAELFEIDTRFGELGSSGIFAALSAAGVLGDGVSGLRDIEEAIEQPPAGGRAEVRGKAIRRHCHESDRYSVEWQQIVDHEQPRVLDLNDPFGRDAIWKPVEQIPRRYGNDQFRRLLASRRQLWPER